MKTLLLIDANSLINRAFYALPPLNNAEGQPTQAVYGFTTMLLKLIETYNPTHIAAAFDLPAPTFRHKKYDGYKATRKGMPSELALQVPLLKNLLSAMNIKVVDKEGFEADDIIGTLAKKFDVQTYIVTGDRDSFQLIDDNTTVLMTKRGITEILKLDEAELKKHYSLTPLGVIEYKALAGDSSDNIPGVQGIGEKTALSLLEKYHDLDGIYNNIDKISGKLKEKLQNDKQMAYLSKELATINTNVPLNIALGDLQLIFPFNEKVRDIFGRYNFKTLCKKEELFCTAAAKQVQPDVKEIAIDDLDLCQDFAIHVGDKVYVGTKKDNYVLNIEQTLFSDGNTEQKLFEKLKHILCDSNVLKIVFDYKNFIKQTSIYGYEPQNVFDVKLAQYLLGEGDFSTFANLLEYYGYEPSGYACYQIYLQQVEQLKELGLTNLYYDIELPLSKVLYNMEKRGFRIDLKKLEQLNAEYSEHLDICAKKIYELAGKQFNINSPKQLAAVLFDDLKIPYPKKNKTHSTSVEILEPLTHDYEIVAYVLRYRFIAKLNSTYLEGLKKQTDTNGLIHTEFKQTLTTTGRLSSVEPNLQNIPVREEEGRALRGIFVASEGNVLLSADYSQIELRVMAHLSQDKKMIECYNAGEDIHTATAAEVFGVPLSEVTSKMRREAKVVNFGIIYGMSEYGLAQNLKISYNKSREYIKKYFERFYGVKEYLDNSVNVAKEKGYATTICGRIRRIPEINSPNFMSRSFGERVAMNMPLQGSAADIIKIAMLKTEEALKDTGAKLILQIHDELIVESPINEVNKIKQILKDCMENAIELSIPLEVSVGVGKNWMECK